MKRLLFAILVLVSTSALAQDAAEPKGLKVGDVAPAFSAVDQNGVKVTLADALKKGPVVLVFYRGQWCPYCNKQLSKYNDALNKFKEKNATVMAISPEASEGVKTTVEKTKSNFPVLSDDSLKISKAYDVNYAVKPAMIEKYKGYGIDFNKSNGNNGANLPIPATYIIGTDGKIKYVFFNSDISKRASVEELLANL